MNENVFYKKVKTSFTQRMLNGRELENVNANSKRNGH